MRILILLGLNVLSLCASQNVESSWYFPRSSAMLRNQVPLLTTLIVSYFELGVQSWKATHLPTLENRVEFQPRLLHSKLFY